MRCSFLPLAAGAAPGSMTHLPPSLAPLPMAPAEEAAVQSPQTRLGLPSFLLQWEDPLSPTTVSQDGVRAEGFFSGGLAHVPASKGGRGVVICRVLVAALPSGAASLSCGSPVQRLAAVAAASFSLLVLLCSISCACGLFFFCEDIFRYVVKFLAGLMRRRKVKMRMQQHSCELSALFSLRWFLPSLVQLSVHFQNYLSHCPLQVIDSVVVK